MPTTDPAAQQAAPPEAPAAPRAGQRFAAWARRVPTGWFAGILTGLFLAVTAAFGGLAQVAPPAVAALEPGDAQVGPQLALEVERAVLFETFPEAGAYAGDGEVVLALLVNAENRWSEPFPSSHGAVEQALRVEGLGDAIAGAEPASIARLDDATFGPWLQPGVPADLVVSWVVPADSVAEGDGVRVVIREAMLERGQRLTSDERWSSPKPVAAVELAVVRGAAAEGEQ